MKCVTKRSCHMSATCTSSGLSVITVEKYKKVNSLVGCQLMDWERVNAESRESR